MLSRVVLCRATLGRAVSRRWLVTAPLPRRIPPSIQTLNPSLLTASDYIDISEKKCTSFHLPGLAIIRYGFADHSYRPFPPNSRGFLYWHQDPTLPPTTATLRFRLTSGPDPALFPSGTDLRVYAGTSLWSISLPRIATGVIYAPIKDHLIAQRLVDPTLFHALEVANATTHTPNPKPDTQALCSLYQPFEIDLASTTYLQVFSKRAFGPIFLTYICFDYRRAVSRPPYTGRILVRFELSPLPQHVARPPSRLPVLVLRVLQTLAPIKPATPEDELDKHVPLPVPGKLLQVRVRARKLFTVDLEKPGNCLRYLKLLVPGDAGP